MVRKLTEAEKKRGLSWVKRLRDQLQDKAQKDKAEARKAWAESKEQIRLFQDEDRRIGRGMDEDEDMELNRRMGLPEAWHWGDRTGDQ